MAENNSESKKVEEQNEKTPEFVRNSFMIGLGFNMVVGFFVFAFIGYKIDEKYDSSIWTLVGISCGLIYCGYEIWKIYKQQNN